MTRNDYIFHVIAYYLAWFGAILLAAKQQSLYATLIAVIPTLLQVGWQYQVIKRTQGLWLMVFLFVLLGTLSDTLLMKVGLITFSANPFADYFSAPWMSALWLSFGITFYSTMSSWFKSYLLVSVLSLISFPIAYAAGVALHAAYLPYGYSSVIVTGLIWAIIFPLILRIYQNSWGQT